MQPCGGASGWASSVSVQLAVASPPFLSWIGRGGRPRPCKHHSSRRRGRLVGARGGSARSSTSYSASESSVVIEHERHRILSSLSLFDPDALPQADETRLGGAADGGGQGDPVRSSSTRIYSAMPVTIHAGEWLQGVVAVNWSFHCRCCLCKI